MRKELLEESIGKIDYEELEILAKAGGHDIQPQSTPLTTSSVPCASATVASATAVSDFITNFFSCGKFC